MPLPYKIATLLYCFNERGEILLLERAQEPNRSLWSVWPETSVFWKRVIS